MYRIPYLRRPGECTDGELREFVRLVREGFDGSDDSLVSRIGDATCLAFQRAIDGTVIAVAGIKNPSEEHTAWVFAEAGAGLPPADCRIELGWVYVVPEHQGNRIASKLCGELIKRSRGSFVYATTRPDNVPMIRILLALGFARTGRPFVRRGQELALFIRSRRTGAGPSAAV